MSVVSIPTPTPTSHYTLLGVTPQSTPADITLAYRKLATELHPDRPSGNADLFSMISESYDLLCNPVQRALYDLEMGFVEDSPEFMKKIHNLRRQAAMKELRNMTEKSRQIGEIERERNGLIIIEAKYGDLTATHQDILDVSIQLQSYVVDSMLIMREGQSKSWMEGFYDVCEGRHDNELHVIYKLGGKYHEYYGGEFDELIIPQPQHIMGQVQVFDYENKQRKMRRNMGDVKSKRRFILYSSLLVASMGLFYYVYKRHNGTGKKEEGQGEGMIKPWIDRIISKTNVWNLYKNTNNSNSNGSSSSSSSSPSPPSSLISAAGALSVSYTSPAPSSSIASK